MDESHYNLRLIFIKLFLSGRKDLNLRPLAPHASALAGLRHAPNRARLYTVLKELTIVLGYSSLVMKALTQLPVEAFDGFEF